MEHDASSAADTNGIQVAVKHVVSITRLGASVGSNLFHEANPLLRVGVSDAQTPMRVRPGASCGRTMQPPAQTRQIVNAVKGRYQTLDRLATPIDELCVARGGGGDPL